MDRRDASDGPDGIGYDTREWHHLFAWKTPRVRTKRAALAALPHAPDSFGQSPDLARLKDALSDDDRVRVDQSLFGEADRLLFLAVARVHFNSAGPRVAAMCEQLGLVLFDPEGERLVVPRSSRSSKWPPAETPLIDTVREAIVSTLATGGIDADQLAVDETVLAATHGKRLGIIGGLPTPRPLPFPVPAMLRFALPVELAPRRQSKAALVRLLTDLSDPRSEVRRAAALDLGGWTSSSAVDQGLVGRLMGDPDGYVRAVAALSLAVRGTDRLEDVLRVAEGLVTDAASGNKGRWAGIASSIGTLAAAVVAASSGDIRLCWRVKELARTLEGVASEEHRAKAISDSLGEFCG